MKNDYHATDPQVLEKAIKLKDLFFAISVIIVTILNLWLTTKLYPLAQGIDKVESRVLANEDHIKAVEAQCNNGDTLIWKELNYIRSRVDDIYNRLK